MNTNQDRSKT